MDNLWLHDAHFNHNIGHCLVFMESGLDAVTLANHIHDRILDRTNESGQPLFQRFMKKVRTDEVPLDIQSHIMDVLMFSSESSLCILHDFFLSSK